jgi:serine O-acetyltransferase
MTKSELRISIKEDKQYYYGTGLKRLYRTLTHNPLFRRGEYIITCRKVGFYSTNKNGLFNKIKLVYYTRKRNILGEKLHIELGPAEFGRRLRIYHNDIVVNAGAVIGDDCELYGNNCIGNKGSDYPALAAPQLGNGVSLGVGASVVGPVHIADGCKISGMSFVNKDLIRSNSLYGGYLLHI